MEKRILIVGTEISREGELDKKLGSVKARSFLLKESGGSWLKEWMTEVERVTDANATK